MDLGNSTLERQSAYDIGIYSDHDLKRVRDVSMYKMATAGVPSGTILAVHLQKCLHLSNFFASSFSIIKQLMPALAVNIIIVHIKCRR